MTTAGARLAALSGLTAGTAAQHLVALAGRAGIAGALLAATSGLPPGQSAALHLLAERRAATVWEAQGGPDSARTELADRSDRLATLRRNQARTKQQNRVAIALVIALITQGILA